MVLLPDLGFSGHIPDFALISHISEYRDSPLHRCSSYLKLIYLIVVVVAATVLQNIIALLILYTITLMIYRIGRLSFRLLCRWYLVPVSFVLAIALLFVFNEPGRPILSFNLTPGAAVIVTDAGLILFFKLIVRSLSVVTYSFAIMMTTRYAHISYMANRILPTPLNTVFVLSYRFSFVIFEEVRSLLKALSSRGGDLIKGFLMHTRIFGGIIAVAFVHSFDRADRIAKAMEARGFEKKLPTYSVPTRPSTLGIVALILNLVTLTLAIISDQSFLR
jgi:cobalt/nickel transport system permease protein